MNPQLSNLLVNQRRAIAPILLAIVVAATAILGVSALNNLYAIKELPTNVQLLNKPHSLALFQSCFDGAEYSQSHHARLNRLFHSVLPTLAGQNLLLMNPTECTIPDHPDFSTAFSDYNFFALRFANSTPDTPKPGIYLLSDQISDPEVNDLKLIANTLSDEVLKKYQQDISLPLNFFSCDSNRQDSTKIDGEIRGFLCNADQKRAFIVIPYTWLDQPEIYPTVIRLLYDYFAPPPDTSSETSGTSTTTKILYVYPSCMTNAIITPSFGNLSQSIMEWNREALSASDISLFFTNDIYHQQTVEAAFAVCAQDNLPTPRETRSPSEALLGLRLEEPSTSKLPSALFVSNKFQNDPRLRSVANTLSLTLIPLFCPTGPPGENTPSYYEDADLSNFICGDARPLSAYAVFNPDNKPTSDDLLRAGLALFPE